MLGKYCIFVCGTLFGWIKPIELYQPKQSIREAKSRIRCNTGLKYRHKFLKVIFTVNLKKNVLVCWKFSFWNSIFSWSTSSWPLIVLHRFWNQRNVGNTKPSSKLKSDNILVYWWIICSVTIVQCAWCYTYLSREVVHVPRYGRT